MASALQKLAALLWPRRGLDLTSPNGTCSVHVKMPPRTVWLFIAGWWFAGVVTLIIYSDVVKASSPVIKIAVTLVSAFVGGYLGYVLCTRTDKRIVDWAMDMSQKSGEAFIKVITDQYFMVNKKDYEQWKQEMLKASHGISPEPPLPS